MKIRIKKLLTRIKKIMMNAESHYQPMMRRILYQCHYCSVLLDRKETTIINNSQGREFVCEECYNTRYLNKPLSGS